MLELVAYATVAVTIALAITRPRIGSRFRISPALAAFTGVLMMSVAGITRLEHLGRAASDLWPPFLALASIMVMTEVALRVGLIDWWASRVEANARSTAQLFTRVFALGVLTSTALNNDAAILLLTPAVVAVARRRYPDQPALVVTFAFGVFMSAGVAALPVSNPMNMVVADFMGIGFNSYAMHMIPVAVAGWVIAYGLLRVVFARHIRAPLVTDDAPAVRPASTPQRLMMALLAAVLVGYSAVGYFEVPVWPAALTGAAAALVLAIRHCKARPHEVVIQGVSWDTLGFLLGVLILAMGLLEVGLVDRIAAFYAGESLTRIGATSALGSAVFNNHPMALLNMLALDIASSSDIGVLAALVGGDLGPRLLPTGSLAGLLWLELLRRHGVPIRVTQFTMLGLLVTVPAMAASLAILSLY